MPGGDFEYHERVHWRERPPQCHHIEIITNPYKISSYIGICIGYKYRKGIEGGDHRVLGVGVLIMSESMSLSELIDLERYPLRDDMAFAPVADRCRAQLKESSFASLPGFLRPDVAKAMTSEVLDAIPRAYRREQSFSAYEESTLEQYPIDHVRRRKHRCPRQNGTAADTVSR
jgi:hypothetical protein